MKKRKKKKSKRSKFEVAFEFNTLGTSSDYK